MREPKRWTMEYHTPDIDRAIRIQKAQNAELAAKAAAERLTPEEMKWRLVKESILYATMFIVTFLLPPQYMHGMFFTVSGLIFFGGGLCWSMAGLATGAYSSASRGPDRQ